MARAAPSRRRVARDQHRRRSARPPRAGEEAAPPPPDSPPGRRAPVTHAPNDLWAADFKGQFRTGDRIYCYPLTVTDQHTRYLLACHGLLSTRGTGVRQSSIASSASTGCHGRCGPTTACPFASTSLHGLTSLNVWWLRLGIQHQRILPGASATERRPRAHAQDPEARRDSAAPGHPRRPAAGVQPLSRRVQPRAAPSIPRGRTPGALYRPSIARATPARSPRSSIPRHFLVKRVTNAGTIRFKTRLAVSLDSSAAASRRPRRGRRRDLVALLLQRAAGTDR